jgi:hypothetical protein
VNPIAKGLPSRRSGPRASDPPPPAQAPEPACGGLPWRRGFSPPPSASPTP